MDPSGASTANDELAQPAVADSTGADSATLAVDAPAHVATSVRTPWSEFWRKFRKQRVAVVAGMFVLLLVAIAIAAPAFVPYDAENFFDYDSINALPSVKHWFGVDPLGRDIFSRILMGSRISL